MGRIGLGGCWMDGGCWMVDGGGGNMGRIGGKREAQQLRLDF